MQNNIYRYIKKCAVLFLVGCTFQLGAGKSSAYTKIVEPDPQWYTTGLMCAPAYRQVYEAPDVDSLATIINSEANTICNTEESCFQNIFALKQCTAPYEIGYVDWEASGRSTCYYSSITRLKDTVACSHLQGKFPREVPNDDTVAHMSKYCGANRARFNPSNSKCECPDELVYDSEKNMCVALLDVYQKQESCQSTSTGFAFSSTYGNPVRPSTGGKIEEIDLGRMNGIPLYLSYDTDSGLRPASTDFSQQIFPNTQYTGQLWKLNVFGWFRRFSHPDQSKVAFDYSVGNARIGGLETPSSIFWAGSGKELLLLPSTPDKQSVVANMALSRFDIFNSAGFITDFKFSDGRAWQMQYVDTLPSMLGDQNGRQISFGYTTEIDSTKPRLASITSPGDGSISLSYNSANELSGITFQDGTAIGLIYDQVAGRNVLAGITDQNGSRYATFTYYENGAIKSTEHAGVVNKYEVNYSALPVWQYTDEISTVHPTTIRTHSVSSPQHTTIQTPTGGKVKTDYAVINGQTREISKSQPAGSGCNASTSSFEYNQNGWIIGRTDFSGHKTCYARDQQRALVYAQTDGIDDGANCNVLIGNLPLNAKQTSTQWHPDWHLKSKVAQPGLITTYVYNGQPDPSAGNALATCAPTGAPLPNGQPIAVLCKRIDQPTTDANGAQGFGAAATGSARTWSWTYNPFGQVLTEDGPRNDVADITTYTYYSDTTATHTRGDMQRMTNAAGQTTTYDAYNPTGQLLQSTDPNGVVTTYTYDLRQRLTSVSEGGQTTIYTYDPVGQLTRVSAPDGSYIGHTYDAAHRHIGSHDHQGNRIDYVLDNAGNRVSESTLDPSGALRRQINRSFDALGRMQQTTGP